MVDLVHPCKVKSIRITMSTVMCFKSMSGLKINFEESEAVVTSCDLEAGSAQIGAHD